MYKKFIKRSFDIVLSFAGLICLSWLYVLIAIGIYIDDPGPVLFTQKRICRGKKYFTLHKFRTMKVSAPHDVPTHLFNDANEYITSVGKILRKMSLDELPQIWDIFIGKMSIIGPRPALWNQYDLISERDKYGVNDVRPGLTGLAQISGRDELEISEKAKIDGEYVAILNSGGVKPFFQDVKCFFKTFLTVASRNGVVEGNEGNSQKDTVIEEKVEV